MIFHQVVSPRARAALRHVAARSAGPAVPADLRINLGARVAVAGVVDPKVIGDAARGGRYALQDLKMVWHTLARFGTPEGAGTARDPFVTGTPTT